MAVPSSSPDFLVAHPGQPSMLLYFRDFSSNKLYYAAVLPIRQGWGVFTRYGRFPDMPQSGWKCHGVSYEKALKEYTSIVTEKLNKGYGEIGITPDYHQEGNGLCPFDHLPTYTECIQLLRKTLNETRVPHNPPST